MKKLDAISDSVKIHLVFITFLVASAFTLIFSYICASSIPKWYGILIGIVFVMLAIPLHRFGKRYWPLYILTVGLNSVSCGFLIGGYHAFNQIILHFPQMLLSTVPGFLILTLVWLSLLFTYGKRRVIGYAAVIWFGLLISLLVLWLSNGNTIYSFGFFMLVFSGYFLVGYGVTACNDRHVFSDLSFCSFGAFLMVLIVLIIISEGGILDVLDMPFSGGSGHKRR